MWARSKRNHKVVALLERYEREKQEREAEAAASWYGGPAAGAWGGVADRWAGTGGSTLSSASSTHSSFY
jgi:hypothetical protein